MTGGGKRQRPLLSALPLEDNIMKKVAIVTGSSRGIGYAIVRGQGWVPRRCFGDRAAGKI